MPEKLVRSVFDQRFPDEVLNHEGLRFMFNHSNDKKTEKQLKTTRGLARALASLERIKEQQIWKENKVKEYYSEISDTIRLYIEERFQVHALESTTDEIMTAFRSQVVDKESKDKLMQLLMLSDLVKFAKQFPIEIEHNLTLQNAFDFVNTTKREEVVILPEETNSSNPE